MTVDDARAIFDAQSTWYLEGWLDTAARLDEERGLTAEEKEASDLLWAEFVASLRDLAAATHPTDTADDTRVSQSRPK